MLKPNIALRDIGTVHPYELNAKIHDVKQVERIAKSIREFGWDQPIVVDADGVIIKGHGRRLAALSLGLTQVPVWVRDDLTPAQVRASRLADNRVAVGDLNTDVLQQELADLEFDLSGIFDKKELDFVVADLGEINADAFVADIENEVATQAEKTMEKIREVDERSVKVQDALGFKFIKGGDERTIASFMATIEEDTGLTGADAFVAFAKSCLVE